MITHRSLLASMVVVLSGCGVTVHGPAATAPRAAVQAPQPAKPVVLRLDFTKQSIHQGPICGDGPLYAGKLTLDGLLGTHVVPGNASAIMTLDASGASRWNTADGHRWTEAEAQAAAARGIQPWLLTPWTMHRTGAVLRGSLASDRLTAYVGGGTLGADSVAGCGPLGHPAEPGTYLASLRADGSGFTYIMSLMPYDPATRTVQTPYGVLTLPSTSG
jgi:hypothetical protein